MLFTYTEAALAENWLNATIVQMLREGMLAIMAGGKASEWPGSIPLARRATLKSRHGVKKRLTQFWKEFASLKLAEQQDLFDALGQQNAIPDILFNDAACIGIDHFPPGIRNKCVELFEFLFGEQLVTLKVGHTCLRDLHYSALYEELPSRVCPFCGIGSFRAPGAPRHALDHYMPIWKYPFVGADFRNLAPMCTECNSSFKGKVDILFDDAGLRRRCSDPYNGPTFRVSLADSQPFKGEIEHAISLPKWKINFEDGPPEQAESWDSIFRIRERYDRDVLNAEFRSWLEHFAKWFNASNYPDHSGDHIAAKIPIYIESVIQEGWANKAFLKAEVFRLLVNECADADRGDDMKAFLELIVANV